MADKDFDIKLDEDEFNQLFVESYDSSSFHFKIS